MAVSLVSTGVQFPDSTIQTTAATASAAPGMVLLQAVTASASSTVDLTSFSSTYDNYQIVATDIRPTNDADYLQAQLNTGGTWRTVDGYKYVAVFSKGLSNWGVGQYYHSSVESRWYLTPDTLKNASYATTSLVMNIPNPNNSSSTKGVYGQIFTSEQYPNTTLNVVNFSGTYLGTGTTNTVQGVRFLAGSGGTLAAGSFRLYGLRKTV